MNVDLLIVTKALVGGRDAWERLKEFGITRSSLEGEATVVHDWISSVIDAGRYPTFDEAKAEYSFRWPDHSRYRIDDLIKNITERKISLLMVPEMEEIARQFGKGDGYAALEKMKNAIARAEEIGLPQKEVRTLFSLGQKVLDRYYGAKAGANVIKTPWDSMNRMIGGFQRRANTGFVARPGIGKTTTAVVAARHAFIEGYNVGVVSPEMDADEVAEPFLVLHSQVPYIKVVLGELSPKDEDTFCAMIASMKELKNLWILDDDDDMSFEGISRFITDNELDAVFFDSFYEMNRHVADDRERLDKTTGQFLRYRKLNKHRGGVALVGSTQFARANTGKGGTEGSLETIGMSDIIAKRFQFLFRMSRTDEQRTNNTMEYTGMKIRRGDPSVSSSFITHWDWVKCVFDEIPKPRSSYSDIDRPGGF